MTDEETEDEGTEIDSDDSGGRIDDVEETVEEQRERVEERAEEALDTVDENIDRLLSEALDTRARVAVYVSLRNNDGGTVEDVAEASGLYPDKVERVLEDLEDDGIVDEETEGVYTAISPTELVRRVPESVGEWLESALERSSDDEEPEDIAVE